MSKRTSIIFYHCNRIFFWNKLLISKNTLSTSYPCRYLICEDRIFIVYKCEMSQQYCWICSRKIFHVTFYSAELSKNGKLFNFVLFFCHSLYCLVFPELRTWKLNMLSWCTVISLISQSNCRFYPYSLKVCRLLYVPPLMLSRIWHCMIIYFNF